jgi:hypothetical protein
VTHESAGAPVKLESARPPSRFIAVRPDELDRLENFGSPATSISLQTWILAVGLIAIGLLAWRLLQPPSADATYRRISDQVEAGDSDSLLQAEDDIRDFLMRFPSDPRCETLRGHAREIDLTRLERKLELQARGRMATANLTPVERLYLDALRHAWTNPDVCMTRFQAIVDLYEVGGRRSGPTWQCVELAKRRLARLREQQEAQAGEHLALIQERLDRADSIRKSDPARAAAMYRAVIELYQDRSWAADAVRRAKNGLGVKQ